MPLRPTKSLHLGFFPNEQTSSTDAGIFKSDIAQTLLPRLFENQDA
jgi:hypothetical protein